MLGTQNLGLFVVTALVLNATPGVDLLFTLTRTLQGGMRAGLAAALGIVSGCIVHTLAAALGLAALLAASSLAFTLVKWLGAAYLLWLALGLLREALRSAPGTAAAAVRPAHAAWRRIYRQGFLTNVLNPKVALFFLALLPQFIAAEAANKPLAFLLLGAIFVVNGTLFLLVVVLAAARVRRLAAGTTARRWLNAGGGALFAALAMRLALAERAT